VVVTNGDVGGVGGCGCAPLVRLSEILLMDETVPPAAAPDVVLQVGGRLISTRCLALMAAAHTHALFEDFDERCDASYSVTHRVGGGNSAAALTSLLRMADAPARPPSALQRWLCAASTAVETAISKQLSREHDCTGGGCGGDGDGSGGGSGDGGGGGGGGGQGDGLSEVWAVRQICKVLESYKGSVLFSSNSGPIRHLNSFCPTAPSVLCNRGASGIDGIIHSAMGAALGVSPRACTLVIGDLAALHDLSGLAAASKIDGCLVIVLLNNGGGGIFRSLPVAKYTEVFSPYFDTPHDHRFQHACEGFRIPYACPETRAGFTAEYEAALARGGSSVIEVVLPNDAHLLHSRELLAVAKRVVSDIPKPGPEPA